MKLASLPFSSVSRSVIQKMSRHVVWYQEDFSFIIQCLRASETGPLLL
jgi:hypothetical protein